MARKIDMGKAWDKISQSYQQRYRIGTEKIHWGPLCPSEDQLNLLGDVYGKEVLEVGSGAGQNSIVLAKKGAKATALDISKEQLKYGQKLSRKEGVDVSFIRGNFEKIRKLFAPNSFDIAFSAYALQYCRNVKSMNETFEQIFEILKEGGRLVFSLDHPVRAIGHWNEETDRFILDNYFDRSTKEWDYTFPEKSISARMRGSFMTISDIVNGVLGSGFRLEKLLEPEPVKTDSNSLFGVKSRYGEHGRKDPYSFDHLSRIPGTLIIKAQK